MTDKHTHHHDYTQANADHYSEWAQRYRTEMSLELAKRCAASIRQKYPFDSNRTEILDFACGPGLVAFELLPFAKRIVGADSSQGMVDVFNKTVQEQGIAAEKCHCIKTDALKNDQTDFDGLLFDVIICTQCYHHFEDPTYITRALAKHLKPQGRLLVIDFNNDGNREKMFAFGSEHTHIVPHKHGFRPEEMTEMFKAADLQNIQVQDTFQTSKAELKSYRGHEVFGKIMESDVDFTLTYFIASGDKA